MFLDYMGLSGHFGEAFLFNGGGPTLKSYGLDGYVGVEVRTRMPPEHVEFLRDLRLSYTAGEFLCVHAGIHPLRPLDQQQEEDLLWIREEFIRNRHSLPYTVLFGHTPQKEVLLHLPYKVGLDTGLVYWNKLSCLDLESKELLQLTRGQRKVKSRNIGSEFEDGARQARS